MPELGNRSNSPKISEGSLTSGPHLDQVWKERSCDPLRPSNKQEVGEKSASRPAPRWESCACPTCGSIKQEPFRTINQVPGCDRPVKITRCLNCDLPYLNPRPDEESMSIHYNDDIVTHQFYKRGKPGATSLRDRLFNKLIIEHRDGSRINLLKRLLPSLDKNTRILDFGCGTASFLKQVHATHGCQSAGIENAPNALEALRADPNLTVYESLAAAAVANKSPFDAITLCHVLEHLHEPVKALKQLLPLSTSETQLVIEVPNLDSWPLKIFGEDWLGWGLPHHLSFYTPTTLEDVLARAGWQLERFYFPKQVVGLVYSLGTRLKRPWIQDMHGCLFQTLTTYSLLLPMGLLMSALKKNDFLIAVAKPMTNQLTQSAE